MGQTKLGSGFKIAKAKQPGERITIEKGNRRGLSVSDRIGQKKRAERLEEKWRAKSKPRGRD